MARRLKCSGLSGGAPTEGIVSATRARTDGGNTFPRRSGSGNKLIGQEPFEVRADSARVIPIAALPNGEETKCWLK
jgi:hypothetical protein